MTVWIYASTFARADEVARVLRLTRDDYRAFCDMSLGAQGVPHRLGDRVIVLHGLSERLEWAARRNAATYGLQVEYWAEHVDARPGGEP